MKVIGIGDNVCDKYVHLKTMFPGGQALNFAVYAKMLGADASALPRNMSMLAAAETSRSAPMRNSQNFWVFI